MVLNFFTLRSISTPLLHRRFTGCIRNAVHSSITRWYFGFSFTTISSSSTSFTYFLTSGSSRLRTQISLMSRFVITLCTFSMSVPGVALSPSTRKWWWSASSCFITTAYA